MSNIQRSSTKNGSGRRPSRLASRLAAGGGAAALALLMALAGGAAAAPTGVTVHGPYSGTVSSISVSGGVSGCGASLTNPVKPHWVATSGAVNMSGTTKAAACPGTSSGSGANLQNQVTVAIPIPIGYNGTHTITIKWNYTLSLPKSLRISGACPSPVINSYGYGSSYCSASATASLGAYAHVEDITNSTYAYPTNYWGGATNGTSISSNENCYGGTCSFYNSSSNSYGGLGKHSFTWWINGTFNKGDKVIVVLTVYGYASVSAYGYPKGSASAGFNLATLANGAKLSSIHIT